MRINCEVLISNRQLPALNLGSKCRGTRASLAIGKLPGAKSDLSNLFVHLCTAVNKKGTKYKISENIEAVFTKFIGEGKFTIRFKEPQHDICIKADPVLAKSFITTLKLGLRNKDIDKLALSNLVPVKQCQVEAPKTKLVINSRNDYPITSTFPYSMESLIINGISLNHIENRILKLKRLSVLNLNDNSVTQLPQTLNLSSLTQLHLAKNRLKVIHQELFSSSLAMSLSMLDLSDNQLQYLPHTIGKLKNLVSLKVDRCELLFIPMAVGMLKKLQHLSASMNKLQELPASMTLLNLQTIDISGNPFSGSLGLVLDRLSGSVPKLCELAAKCCVSKMWSLTSSDIPATLLDYLRSHTQCLCGRVCFESHMLARVPLNLRNIAVSVTVPAGSTIPGLVTLCSVKCHIKYIR